MTGTPMPMDAQQRMQMAPEVFQFTKNFAKKPNILEKTGNLVKNIGKTVGMGLAVAAAAPAYLEQQGTTGAKSTDSGPKPIGKTPDGQLLYDAADLNNSGVEQQKTTADNLEQDRVENQTGSNQILRSGIQKVDLENNETIAKGLVSAQDFNPVLPGTSPADTPLLAAGFDATPKKSEKQILSEMKQYEEQAGLNRIGGPANVSEKVEEFLKQGKINPVLFAAMQNRGKEEELVGTSFPIASQITDNPQIALDGGQSTRAQSREFIKETEPIGGMPTNVDPSTLTPEVKNVLSNIAKGMATIPLEKQIDAAKKIVDSRSPNEVFGKESKDRDLISTVKEGIPLKDREAAKSRLEQKTAAKQRQQGIKSALTEKYYPEGVARTDIQVGGMKDRKTGLGRSVGISYTPMNGDTKVGFNMMPDPTKPSEVKTYDFKADQDTVESMKVDDKFSKLFNLAAKRKEGFSSYET
jgi:hypothetical protein